MLILGIDPGSRVTGYGMVESRVGHLRVVDYGTIVPPAGLDLMDRLLHIAAALDRLALRAHPDVAAIEDMFHARNSRVALQLAQVRGVAMLSLRRAGLTVHEYAPRLVKKVVTGYGAADKEQVSRMVRVLLHLEGPMPAFDASDALAIAICHAHSSSLVQRLQQAARA
jgi:crossover junction endodeoxyribonuclease RuvC